MGPFWWVIISLDIPDAVADSLDKLGPSVPRAILEGFAVEAHRQGLLTAMQVGLLFGHVSRWETQRFLASRDALRSLSVDDILEDAEVAASARATS